ncbi:DUF6221 family protein [Streptomyces sp. NPDC058398]|uniref:DUF6221 family protein n=1 Tax=Streptomyces sp. NPDC058398 TaxID=3346479 RepID=UPI00364F32AF
MSMELVDFLLARFDEDAEMARAWPDDQRDWEVSGARYVTYAASSAQEQVMAIGVGGSTPPGWERITVKRDVSGLAAHIVRHDPARTLADIESKQRIVANLAAVQLEQSTLRELRSPLAEVTLRMLAQPYRDHPDFDPTWLNN